MAAVGRLLFSARFVIRANLQESVKSFAALSCFVKPELTWQTRYFATSNQGGVTRVKTHSRTPYIIFASEKMNDIRTSNPDIRVPDIGRMLGQLWRNLSEDEKETYRVKYREEKVTFDEQKKAQIEKLSEEEKENMKTEARERRRLKVIRKRKKILKELQKPKPGDVNPYILFVRAKALERGDAPFQQYVRGLAEFWKKMPEEDKQPYVEEAQENSVKYRRELAEWEQRMIAEGHEDLVRRSALNRPKKPRKGKLARKKIASSRRRPSARAAKTKTVATQTETKPKSNKIKSADAEKRKAGTKSGTQKSEE